MSACIQEPVATNSKQGTGHEFCTVWAEKWPICGGVHLGGGGPLGNNPGGGRGGGVIPWRGGVDNGGGEGIMTRMLQAFGPGMWCFEWLVIWGLRLVTSFTCVETP